LLNNYVIHVYLSQKYNSIKYVKQINYEMRKNMKIMNYCTTKR